MFYYLYIITNFKIMACSCKSGASSKQVTSVKQVVKKPVQNTMAATRPQRKNITRRVIRRPM